MNQTKQALITVIIPVYNVEPYIRRCLDSVISQTYTDLEILLVDDGSTDLSGTICDEYAISDERIKVIHKENGGLSDARNVAIEQMKGTYVTFIDSDDWVSPRYVELMYLALRESGSNLVICDHIRGNDVHYRFDERIPLDHSDSSRRLQLLECLHAVTYTSEEALHRWHGEYKDIETFAWGKLYQSRLFLESGIRYPKGYYYEDTIVTHRLYAQAGTVTYIGPKLYYYYQRSGSIMNSFSVKQMKDMLYMQELRLKWFRTHSYMDAYWRLYSKVIKYYMLNYVKVQDPSIRKELLKRFRKKYHRKNLRLRFSDRILFTCFDGVHSVIAWFYQAAGNIRRRG